MKPFPSWFVVGLLVLSLAACAPPEQDVEKEIAALKAMESEVTAAFLSENVDSLMATYWNSPDLVMYSPDTMEVKGFDAVRASYARFFKMGDVKSFEIIDSKYKVSGDIAVGWSKWKLTYQLTGLPEMQWEGRFTGLFMKQAGKWYSAVDHSSMPLPPPPAATSTAMKN